MASTKLELALQRLSGDLTEAIAELKAAREAGNGADIDAAVARLDTLSSGLESVLTTVPANPEDSGTGTAVGGTATPPSDPVPTQTGQ